MLFQYCLFLLFFPINRNPGIFLACILIIIIFFLCIRFVLLLLCYNAQKTTKVTLSHGALTLSSCHTFLIIGINFGHSVINPIFSNSMNEDAQTGSLRHPRRVFI